MLSRTMLVSYNQERRHCLGPTPIQKGLQGVAGWPMYPMVVVLILVAKLAKLSERAADAGPLENLLLRPLRT